MHIPGLSTFRVREMWKHLRIGRKEEGSSKCTYLDKDSVVYEYRRINIQESDFLTCKASSWMGNKPKASIMQRSTPTNVLQMQKKTWNSWWIVGGLEAFKVDPSFPHWQAVCVLLPW